MLEIVIGVVATLAALLFIVAWANVKVTKEAAKAEAHNNSLRQAMEKTHAADKIMRENVADDLVWRKRFSQRMRDQDNS